jgi:PAS domain S-box-containing protein
VTKGSEGLVRGNGSRKKRRLSADDIDEFIESADDEKVRRFWETIKAEKLRDGLSESTDPEHRRFLSIPLYNNSIAILFVLAILSFSTWFLFKYTSIGLLSNIDITQPVLVVVFAFSAIMFHRYVSDKEEIVGMLDEVAGYSVQNESVFENIGNGLIVVDSAGKVTKVNRKAAEMLEASNSELVGKSCQVISVNQGIANILLETLRSGYATANRELEWVSSRGRHYSLQVTTSLLRSKHAHIAGAVAVIGDVTEIRDLQEKLKLNEHLASIGELSAKLGHEIGNSLGGIRLFTDNLVEELSPGDHRRGYAEEILAEVERLKAKVSELKDYSRPVSLDLAKGDLNNVVDEVLSFARNRFEENGISVSRTTGQNLPEVNMDPDQMRGALLNIVINAIQAMTDGGELTVSTQRRNGTVELSVADTGVGIPEGIRSKIFNPFFTTKKMLGTGLGLSIVYKTIQAHGGTIRFDSELGRGTTFTIGLPIETEMSKQYTDALSHC